jgi:hypothetical protein
LNQLASPDCRPQSLSAAASASACLARHWQCDQPLALAALACAQAQRAPAIGPHLSGTDETIVVWGLGFLVSRWSSSQATGIWWRLSDANDQIRVCLKRLIRGIENGRLGHGLGDEQPIKRIAMKGRKRRDPQRSSRSDWQFRKPAFQCSMQNCVRRDLEISAAQGIALSLFPRCWLR